MENYRSKTLADKYDEFIPEKSCNMKKLREIVLANDISTGMELKCILVSRVRYLINSHEDPKLKSFANSEPEKYKKLINEYQRMIHALDNISGGSCPSS
jgi:hypothetical protein